MIDFDSDSVFKLSEIDVDKVEHIYEMMLVDGEEIFAAFKTVRDSVVFTNKRVIACNIQGMTGKRKDYTSLPYSKIQAYSVETAGLLDMDCELDLWFSPIGNVRFEISGGFDIRSFNQILSRYIL